LVAFFFAGISILPLSFKLIELQRSTLQFCKLYTVIENSSQEKKEVQSIECNLLSHVQPSQAAPTRARRKQNLNHSFRRHRFCSVSMRVGSTIKVRAKNYPIDFNRFLFQRSRSKVTNAPEKYFAWLRFPTSFFDLMEGKTPAGCAGVRS